VTGRKKKKKKAAGKAAGKKAAKKQNKAPKVPPAVVPDPNATPILEDDAEVLQPHGTSPRRR
jgi:hypothetical protein